MKISIHLLSQYEHCSQIITGFLSLAQNNPDYQIVIEDHKNDPNYHNKGICILLALIDGIKVVYDVMDGYQNVDLLRYWVDQSDFYFKRSFSAERNAMLLSEEQREKVFPLGMNYFVTCPGNPCNKITRKDLFLKLRGDRFPSYFTADKFEATNIAYREKPKLLFYTRLWRNTGSADPDNDIDALNLTRIKTIRALQKQYGSQFVGGIRDSDVARELAPELIVSKRASERSRYLQLLRESDICIGTLGLHNSTGWKTAEYVAAAKAIVQEKLVYEAPGHFSAPTNYLMFTDEEGLLANVEKLMNNPAAVYEMKKANHQYYLEYLCPSKLIERTLKIVCNR